MDPNQGWWKCSACGKSSSPGSAFCATCGTKAPPPARGSLASYSGVLDTKSFVLPVRKSAIRLWIAIGIGLPLLMSGIYMAVKLLFK